MMAEMICGKWAEEDIVGSGTQKSDRALSCPEKIQTGE